MKIIYHHRTQAEKAEGVHIREIIKALRNEGHEVFTLSPPGIDPFRNEYINQGLKDKRFVFWKVISKYCPQIIFEILEICYNFFTYTKLRSLINKEQADLIYERYAFFNWIGIFLAQKHKIPIFVEINEISGIKRTRGQVLIGLSKLIEKFILRNATAVIVVSEFLKEYIEISGIDSKKIFVVPNGVDSEIFDPSRTNSVGLIDKYELKGKIVLGFVGNFVKWHNFDFFLKVFREITKKVEDVMLLLVGDGPARADIEVYEKKYNLNGKMVITGSVPHNKIAEYINIMDICIIPHSNEYRSPIKMFEYMSMAKSVVAPNVRPIQQIIQDNINGKLFLLSDEGSFRDSLLDLIRNKEERERIGGKARDTILSNFLWKNNARKIADIYKNLSLE